MPEAVWYRSLYWRIAIGFVALLAAILVIQVAVFVWLTLIVGRSSLGPVQLATEVANELSSAMETTPDLAIDAHLRRHFGHIYQPFLVLMDDGRTASNRADGLPPGFIRTATIARNRRLGQEPPEGDFGPQPPPRPPDGPRGGGGRSGSSRRLAETVPIVVSGREVGIVAVPGNPPPASIVMRQLGPTLAWVAAALLVAGSAIMALVIFRPTHKRLRSLEHAAASLGEGRTDVRAMETGGDEVSALARTFNRMADDLSARAAALAESDRARRQLLADVSHELMTPLAAIRGYTETLAMPELTLDADTRQRYLSIIGDETQKLEAMIGDLLDLARLEGGGGSLAHEPVPVVDLFSRVTDRHGPAIRNRQISVDVSVTPETLTVTGDAHRLEQALQNLGANAIRHTPNGGRIELTASPAEDGIRIAVRDTGPGIPPEHVERVFDRFYKVDSSRTRTDRPSGSGLGLSIVKAIVERHGGTVTASNAPDGGAIFEIQLPAASDQLPARTSS
jgi:signal transduction histidine kinase